jgi:hypothetical protein
MQTRGFGEVIFDFDIRRCAKQTDQGEQGCHKPTVQHVLTHCLSSNARTIGFGGNGWMSRNATPMWVMLQSPGF